MLSGGLALDGDYREGWAFTFSAIRLKLAISDISYCTFNEHLSLLPLQVESEVTQDGATGQEGATHAGEQVPVCTVCRAVGLGHMIGLFDQLTVHLVSQWPQIVAGLQDALDDGDRV